MKIKVLCIGDVVGVPGRTIFQKHIVRLKEQYSADMVIVNGENSADGRGITGKIADAFKHNHVDVITSGNHIWDKRDIYSYIAEHRNFLLRPANFPSETPGSGVAIVSIKGINVAVINLQGRVFMREHIDCPFKAIDSLLTFVKSRASAIIIDFHAETTSEKSCFAYHVDGRVSAIVGTHTHVQTADERVLPHGTAFITDLGMCGALNSSIGMKKEPIIQQFMTQMPVRFSVETQGPFMLNGVCITIDTDSGKALAIERVSLIDDTIHLLDEGND